MFGNKKKTFNTFNGILTLDVTNVWLAKKDTKRSSNTLLHLVSFLWLGRYLYLWVIFKSSNWIAATQLNQVRYQFCSRNRMRNGLFLPVLNDTFYVVLPRFAAPPAV